MVENPTRVYRPLWAGVSIMSPDMEGPGSIGCFAVDADRTNWLVTARHVLTAALSNTGQIVSVYQPDDRGHRPISSGSRWRLDQNTDIIAVPLIASVGIVSAVLSVGGWSAVGTAMDGQLVLKCGATTGVTLGVVDGVDATFFSVRHLNDLPDGYELTEGGDSGALWCDYATHAALGIHQGTANGKARATRLDRSLPQLNLSLTPGAILTAL